MPDATINAATSRAETITGALLYLMTAYQRTHCPCLAAAIARHLSCLASHPSADPVVREVCEGLRVEWQATARAAVSPPDADLRH